MNALAVRVLDIAAGQIGVRETKRNRGPEVDGYILAAGLDPTKGSYSWCCAFVFWAFRKAANDLGVPNPMPRTASVMKLWAKTPTWKRSVPVDGAVMIIDHGGGKGHCGIVEHVGLNALVTIEGNTNASGGREGDGVYRRIRQLNEPTGYIDYARPMPDGIS